jgi:hypothetical protein
MPRVPNGYVKLCFAGFLSLKVRQENATCNLGLQLRSRCQNNAVAMPDKVNINAGLGLYLSFVRLRVTRSYCTHCLQLARYLDICGSLRR